LAESFGFETFAGDVLRVHELASNSNKVTAPAMSLTSTLLWQTLALVGAATISTFATR